MKSTTHEPLLEDLPLFASGKTCPESSQQKTTPSDVFWAHWPEAAALSNRQGEDGQTLVMCVARNGKSAGASSMPNTLEWPNDAVVFSLSQTLETGSLHPRFYLSSRACAGILRRAEKRGKELPPMLREALEMVAGGGHDVSVARTLRAQANSAHRADADNYIPAQAFTFSGYSNQPAWISGERTDCLPSSGHSDGSHQGIGVLQPLAESQVVGTLSDGAHNGGGLTAKMPTRAAYSPALANPLTARMGKGINTTLDEGQTAIVEQQPTKETNNHAK